MSGECVLGALSSGLTQARGRGTCGGEIKPYGETAGRRTHVRGQVETWSRAVMHLQVCHSKFRTSAIFLIVPANTSVLGRWRVGKLNESNFAYGKILGTK